MVFGALLYSPEIILVSREGIKNIILAGALTVWAMFARMVRVDVLSNKDLDLVSFAKGAGLEMPRLIWRHIFSNSIITSVVITSLQVGQVIRLEASPGFLGLFGHLAWGFMVSEGPSGTLGVGWLSLPPGVAITILVLALNFFGGWMRDTLDPKLRRA